MFIARLIAVCLAALAATGAEAQEVVDLELMIAVDASGSVDDAEFALQMGGVAAAFRHPDVHAAIASGATGRIAVSVMLWADAQARKAMSRWHVVDGAAAAHAFADLVQETARRRGSFLGRSGTGIGAAVGAAVEQIRKNGIDAPRRVVDVSGDGHETRLMFGEGMMLPEAHRRARRNGVTVNGLAILSDDPNLAIYYEARVISGPGAFVITADGFEDFERAMKLKLIREIQQLVGDAGEGRVAPL